MNDVTPTRSTQAEHLQHGDPVEVKFQPGWTSGWKLVGIKSTGDDRRVIVERIEDGAVLTAISPERVRKAQDRRPVGDRRRDRPGLRVHRLRCGAGGAVMRVEARMQVYNDADQPNPVVIWAEPEGINGANLVTIQIGNEIAEVAAADLDEAIRRCAGFTGPVTS